MMRKIEGNVKIDDFHLDDLNEGLLVIGALISFALATHPKKAQDCMKSIISQVVEAPKSYFGLFTNNTPKTSEEAHEDRFRPVFAR